MFAALLPLIARVGASVGARAAVGMGARAGGVGEAVGARMGQNAAVRGASNLSNQFRSGSRDSSPGSDFTSLVTERNK